MMKNKMRITKLRGDINQCPTCGKYFNDLHAFDRHRVGDIGNRKCLTYHEMKEVGMRKNFSNLWVANQEKEHEEV